MKPLLFHASLPRRRQSGSAVIVVMALLAIMLIYVAGNLRTIAHLGREVRLVEQQQIRRLQKEAARTSATPAITVATNTAVVLQPPRNKE